METRAEILARLRAQLCRGVGPSAAENLQEEEVVSTGLPQLDAWLPEGGLRRGWLVDWLTSPGVGGAVVALWVAHRCAVAADFPTVVVIDPEGSFHPPAAAAWGVSLEALLWVRPSSEQDAWWAWEEALRSGVFPVVWGWVPRLPLRWYRRLQLACESGRGLGMLVRPESSLRQPCWAAVRWRVEPIPSRPEDSLGTRRWRVSAVRVPGTWQGESEAPAVEIVLRACTLEWEEAS